MGPSGGRLLLSSMKPALLATSLSKRPVSCSTEYVPPRSSATFSRRFGKPSGYRRKDSSSVATSSAERSGCRSTLSEKMPDSSCCASTASNAI